MAFVQVAAGAFQMPAHQVVAPLVGEESGQAGSSTTGGARDRRSEAVPPLTWGGSAFDFVISFQEVRHWNGMGSAEKHRFPPSMFRRQTHW